MFVNKPNLNTIVLMRYKLGRITPKLFDPLKKNALMVVDFRRNPNINEAMLLYHPVSNYEEIRETVMRTFINIIPAYKQCDV